MYSYNKEQVGKRIKSIRQQKGLTQESFGKLFGASKGNVATWEKGISLPNASRLREIADLVSITVEELLYGEFVDNFQLVKLLNNNPNELENMIKSNIKAFFNLLDDFEYYEYTFVIPKSQRFYFVKLQNRILLAISLENKSTYQEKDNKDKLISRMTDVVMNNLRNDNESMNEMLYKSDIINNLVALINLESKEFKNIILYLIDVLETIGKQYPKILSFMLNRKLDILSNEINDYFVINNTTKNFTENNDDEIFDENLVIDTVSYEKYKYLQNQIFDLKKYINKNF
ncbi:helix-turn-helix transcriptional regulator [Staphylococcus hominis]|uniref:helix-turn-helix domain-containing protein n=1 Tax=Staphylococcus hominis TaxID=1290 RepID=UPI0030C22E75